MQAGADLVKGRSPRLFVDSKSTETRRKTEKKRFPINFYHFIPWIEVLTKK